MSQQKNQKNVVVYNYDPHPKVQQPPQPVASSRVQTDESPFNVSKVLKAKQQQSNIFHLPQQVDYSKVTPNPNAEKLLPYDMFWWNSQNLKENKKQDVSRPQTAIEPRNNFENLTEEQFLQLQKQQYQEFLQKQQYQEFLQKQQQEFLQKQQQEFLQKQQQELLQKQQQEFHQHQQEQIKQQQQSNPYQVIKEHNEMIETASFAERPLKQKPQSAKKEQEQPQPKEPQKQDNKISNQLQNPAKVYDKVNNPNAELKQRNPNFSDVFGNGLEKYYQQKPQQNSAKKPQAEYMQESELYGVKYHQRQMLKGMSSQMDTHKYYDDMLEKQSKDQVKAKQPRSSSRSPQASPGKNLEKDEQLFPKPSYTELVIRGMGKEVNWEKLNTQLTTLNMLLADITVVKDKQGKIKQHKIIIKHFEQGNVAVVKQWVLTQGGRLVEERVLQSEDEFVKLMKLKEGPKQRPIRIAEEKEKLKKKRPQSAIPVQKAKK